MIEVNNNKVIITVENVNNDGSQYARFFDDSSVMWTADPKFNLMFLHEQEKFLTYLLQRRGYLFLNQVYESLDIPVTKDGQVVGWIYNKENPDDNKRVDFGLLKMSEQTPVDEFTSSILLNFNVDGIIIDKI